MGLGLVTPRHPLCVTMPQARLKASLKAAYLRRLAAADWASGAV